VHTAQTSVVRTDNAAYVTQAEYVVKSATNVWRARNCKAQTLHRDIVLLLTKNQQMEKAFSKLDLGAFFAPQKTGLSGGSGRKSASRIYFWSFAYGKTPTGYKHGVCAKRKLQKQNRNDRRNVNSLCEFKLGPMILRLFRFRG
jgi:hypothetical protein